MASIKDVAEMAGVSLSTASIVANGKSKERKISEATQKKVLETMKTLNYIPNVSAKTLRRGESQKYVVALFWNIDFRSIMMHRFLFGFQKKIKELNAEMSIIIHPYQTGELKKEAASFTGGEFHAAVIGNADGNDMEFLKKSNFQLPIILYNRLLEGFSSVNIDDHQLGIMAAEHLYAQGYRRPAIIHGTQNFPGATGREQAFRNRMEELGCEIPEPRMILAGNSVRGGYECGEQIKAKQEEINADSFFCASDSIALGLLAALADTGLVPEKAGVLAIGNSDPQYSKYHAPSVSVINIPIEEMAEECCDYLYRNMYSPSSESKTRYFETKLYARETTKRK